jgi:tetratricopeptide (TPR) repeat protein
VEHWNLVLGHEGTALETYKDMLANNPENYRYVYLFIRVLRRQEKFSEIIELLRNMAAQDAKQGCPRLVSAYHELASHEPFQLAVVNAAERSNNLEFVKQAYRKAIEAVNGDASQIAILADLRYWYGLFIFYHSETDIELEEALEAWEHNVELVGGRVTNWKLRYTCFHSTRILASAYLQLASNAGLKSASAKNYLQKMENITETGKADWDMMRNDIKLLVGRLYYLMGEEFVAHDCVKGHVRVALDLLSDDDPLNDWQGYYKLAVALMPLQNDVDASAAWSLIGPTDGREAEVESSQIQGNYEPNDISEQFSETKVNILSSRSDSSSRRRNRRSGSKSGRSDYGRKI